MSTNPAPRRAFHAEITIGSDTLADLVRELEDLADRVERGHAGDYLSGGVSSGVILRLSHDPEMTSDRYHAANLAWLDARRAEATR